MTDFFILHHLWHHRVQFRANTCFSQGAGKETSGDQAKELIKMENIDFMDKMESLREKQSAQQ